MPFVGRPAKQGGGGQGGEGFDTLSSNLWVGNLAPNVNDSDLMEIFGKHGEIADLTAYSGRNYGFVYYKHVESAKAAKAALQGYMVKGSPIRVEFAKPAKPSKHLWVGGICLSVTKEQLEDEFLRFGKIQELKLIKDRNTALVEYVRLEDASVALKSLNGKQIGGENLRVDYLRSQPARREQLDFHNKRDPQFRGMGGPEPSQNLMRFHPEAIYSGQKREQPSQHLIGREAGQPSRFLFVGYPPSVIIDEQMLHNAMILYGEIERVKCFPSMHYSLVEFRSVEEARNAKESLEGKLFNDPRISIMFSSSDLASNDFLAPYPVFRGPRPEMFMNDVPLRPPPLDVLGHSNVTTPNNFSGGPPHTGAFRQGFQRPLAPRGGFDALLPTPELIDPSMIHNKHDFGSSVGSSRRRLSSPTSGLLPPAVPSQPQNKASGWDVLDANQISRELKRARTDSGVSFNDSPFTVKGDDLALGLGQPYFSSSQHERIGDRFSPPGVTVPKGPIEVQAAKDYIWRGVITKGHLPVCNARCIPVDKGIDFQMPEVVDCSARTGLDMLAEHCAEAVGFDIVYFLPDSEEDFASYTDFLHYLGSKNRAGVARFNDGITMFLVPPSDFLKNVLNVVGPERLYGVVLTLAEQASGDLPSVQQVSQPKSSMHHMDQSPVLLPYDYNVYSQKEQVSHMDHNKFAYEGSSSHLETHLPPTTELPPTQMITQYPVNSGTVSVSQAGVALTPELIATLASLLPTNSQAPVGQSRQVPLSSSSLRISNPNLGFDKVTSSQSWNHQNQVPDQMGQSSLQFGNQMNSQVPPASDFHSYPSVASITSHPQQVLPDNTQFQNQPYSIQDSLLQQSAVPKPIGNPADASQSYQYIASTQVTQPFEQQVPCNSRYGSGMGNGVAVTASYGLSHGQLPNNSIVFPNQIQGPNVSHPENVVTGTSEVLSDPLNQTGHHQPLSAAPGQITGDINDDKNKRYQSTLQFAANLLQQIQQQQANSQVGQGQGNQR